MYLHEKETGTCFRYVLRFLKIIILEEEYCYYFLGFHCHKISKLVNDKLVNEVQTLNFEILGLQISLNGSS